MSICISYLWVFCSLSNLKIVKHPSARARDELNKNKNHDSTNKKRTIAPTFPYAK